MTDIYRAFLPIGPNGEKDMNDYRNDPGVLARARIERVELGVNGHEHPAAGPPAKVVEIGARFVARTGAPRGRMTVRTDPPKPKFEERVMEPWEAGPPAGWNDMPVGKGAARAGETQFPDPWGVREGRKEKEVFPFLYPKDMGVIEPNEYLIEGWLPKGGIHVLYAYKDTLKSFLAVDWFMSVVSGEPWKGFETKQGLGIYIAGEGNTGLKRRFHAWCIRNKKPFEEMPLALSKFPMQVLDVGNIKKWARFIAKVEADYGEPVKFLVIDTLATNFGPGDENKPTDMARFLANLAIYLKGDRSDLTILVIHHTTKAGDPKNGKEAVATARGGSPITFNAEAVFLMERVIEKDAEGKKLPWGLTVNLKCEHMKDDEPPPAIRLKGYAVELNAKKGNGEPVTSLVLDVVLGERDQAVLNNLQVGKSQRQIAEFLGVSKTLVQRIEARLRAMKLVGDERSL